MTGRSRPASMAAQVDQNGGPRRGGGAADLAAGPDRRSQAAVPAAPALQPSAPPPALVPRQADPWSCGAHAAARALALAGRPVPHFGQFLAGCPQSFGPNTPRHAHRLARSGCLLFLIRRLAPPVGPHPRLLASYIDLHCRPAAAARLASFADFGACARMAAGHLARGEPVVALWYRHVLSAHYVVLTCAPPAADGWMLLDDGVPRRLSADALAEKMDAFTCPWRWSVGIDRFTCLAIVAT